MINIEKTISHLVQEQFPDFYQENGADFLDFVKQYYVWMESQNQALNASRSLLDYRDIDKTLDDFLKYFRSKYVGGVPLDASANVTFLTKHALDLYRSKGTANSIELLFRGLYNDDAIVYLPGSDVFKTSDGTWIKPEYIELSVSSRTKEFVGKEIIGNKSKAKAIIEGLVTRSIGPRILDIAYLSNIRGKFITGEFITETSNLSLTKAPKITGSLTTLTVVSGGANFNVGDVFDITSSIGKQGQARVTAISNQTGKVFFKYANTLVSGGWGYSKENSIVQVAQKMLQVGTRYNTNVQIFQYKQFEDVSQVLANLVYDTARPNNANFSVGDIIENFSNTTGSVVSNAVVVALGAVNSTAGYMVVSPSTGNVAATDTVFSIRPTSRNVSASFNALSGVANATDIITTSSSHSFVNGDIVVYKLLTGNTILSGLSVGAAYYVVNAASSSSLQLSNTLAGAVINVTAGLNETGHVLVRSQGSGVITNYTNRTTSANVIGTNSEYVGVVNVVGQGFLATSYAQLRGSISNTYAAISNVGTGTGATFTINQLTDTETVFLAPDRLSSNNTNNVQYSTNSTVSINLNGNNSGSALQYVTPETLSTGDTQYGGFGFPKLPGASLDSILLDCLRFDATVIGSIASISGLNPGVDYNIDPFVVVNDPFVSSYTFHDYNIRVTPISGTFLYGEQIQQSVNAFATELTVNTFSGTAANGTSMSTVVLNEFVYQSNNTTNVVASGYVMEAGLTGGAGVIKLRDVTGTFKTTTNANTKLKTLTSRATANISFVDTTTFATEARGMIKSINQPPGQNFRDLSVKRINLFNTFEVAANIVGRTSGARATIQTVGRNTSTPVIGLNANIAANVQVANNVATSLSVIDSGFGYADFETVTLTKQGSEFAVTAIVRLGLGGNGGGFYRTTKGFLDSTDRIHDNNYYQDYSYEVQSTIPYDKYVDILKQVVHTAGTKSFGRVLVTSISNTQINASSTLTIT